MRIVDRKTFLEMPEGTVYCKIKKNSCQIDTPNIKGETLLPDDFVTVGLSDFMTGSGTIDLIESLSVMFDNPDKEYRMEMWSGRDGMFDGEEIKFLIFSEEEVRQIIGSLQHALKDAYNITQK